jgi:hypothetical protein
MKQKMPCTIPIFQDVIETLIKPFTNQIIDFLRTYQFCDGSLCSIHDIILVSTINPQQAMDMTKVALSL